MLNMDTQQKSRTSIVVSKEEMMHQWQFLCENRELLLHRMGHPPHAFVKTFGCQGNVADSEKIMGMLINMGCEQAEDEKQADIILYNTCAIRENAEIRLFSMVGELKRLKQANPSILIGLCGCMMQQDTVLETIRQKYRHVDLVFGTFNLYKLPELMKTREESGCTVFDIWQENQEVVEDLPSIRHFPYKGKCQHYVRV